MDSKHRVVRSAQKEEIEDLNKLIQESARGLSRKHYTPQQIESLIRYVFSVDSELIEDQTYYVIDEGGAYLACGGWSKRRTLFGGDHCLDRTQGSLDPHQEAAKIRAFFVAPAYVGQGLAKMLMNVCEEKAKAAGFTKTELMSTLPGVDFYKNQGYVGEHLIDYTLPDGVIVQFMPMSKTF
ncbi:GNAT family N-acetyltransferase [Candidatus Nucleicultrix amoebiphila]|jgi:GNAT superfamily N-acetyltransferase|uniref:N-acetyltransferase domain-containing protein n=1 Tax=Candidatus Nucleicultrix amoebiphila FS5 TaxID=1414854 RepID=A0A1W6N503_9PROT|nr:GNAT family N-acetyltransferase [Candidatus Nucleicultrix amoebiphila]ARN84944.1 hypothetical protein GQ61_06210 [Candidatus Nucleicultrix amoebiphila FS5]